MDLISEGGGVKIIIIKCKTRMHLSPFHPHAFYSNKSTEGNKKIGVNFACVLRDKFEIKIEFTR